MFSDTALIVGVDVHQHTNVTLVMDGAAMWLIVTERFANNRTGTDQLAAYLAQIAQSGGFDTIHIAAEATNNFWLPFFCQLSQSASTVIWPLDALSLQPTLVFTISRRPLGM